MGPFLPLVVTMAVQALVSLSALAAPVMSIDAAATTGIAAGNVGIFIGIVYASACVSSLASGGLVTRYGAIRMSQASLVLCAAGLASAAAATLPMLVLSAVFIGLGYGPVTPASSHILIRTTPRHRMGTIFSIKQTGVPLGGMLAGLAVPPLIMLVGWRGTALVLALACLLMSLATQSIRREFDADRDPAHPVSPGGVARQLLGVLAIPAIRDIGLCSFFFGAMQLCLTTFLVLYLTTTQGLSLALAGTILALAQGAGIVGRLLWGGLADALRAPRAVLGALGLAMGGCALAFAAAGPGWHTSVFAVLSIVFGGTAIGWNGVFLAEVARLAPPGQAGAATGASLFITYAGVVVGPPAFSAMVAASGYAFAYLATGIVLALVGLFLLAGAPRRPAEP
jgi:MFS family permease